MSEQESRAATPLLRRPPNIRAMALDIAGVRYCRSFDRLYDRWHEWNGALFGGALREPLLCVGLGRGDRARGVVGSTAMSATFADLVVISFHGSMFVANFRSFASFAVPRRLQPAYREGTLLHEMLHQWQLEALGIREDADLHDAEFVDKANELAARLGVSHCERPLSWTPMPLSLEGKAEDLMSDLGPVDIDVPSRLSA